MTTRLASAPEIADDYRRMTPEPETQELEPEALAMAEDIRRRVGPDLFEGFGERGGWREWSRGEVALHSRTVSGVPTFKAEMLVEARPLVVAALIKEADLGPGSQQLVQWRVGRITPFLEVVHYVSRLPPPLSARDFCVAERYGVGPDGSVLVLGQDFSDSSLAPVKPSVKAVVEWEESGCVRAAMRRSAWHLAPEWREDDTLVTRVRHLAEIDLHMPVPAAVGERLHARSLLRDLKRLRGMAGAFGGSPLEQRTELDWFYKVVRRHQPSAGTPSAEF